MKGVKNARVQHGKLTKGQRKVLEFVCSCIDSGLPPSRAEITEHFEWTSPNAAQTYLKHLERNGFLELAAGKVARGIKLTPLAMETLKAPA
jgi:repressor LexA